MAVDKGVHDMKSNELKKGDRIRLFNGWYGTIKDNMRGNTRLAEIEGYVTEIGSIYVWDIYCCIKDYKIIRIELTDSQKQDKKRADLIGF